jgi:hypothetical protein
VFYQLRKLVRKNRHTSAVFRRIIDDGIEDLEEVQDIAADNGPGIYEVLVSQGYGHPRFYQRFSIARLA